MSQKPPVNLNPVQPGAPIGTGRDRENMNAAMKAIRNLQVRGGRGIKADLQWAGGYPIIIVQPDIDVLKKELGLT